MSSVDGENSSVEDMSTRQKIASFPSELYNANILEKVTGKPLPPHSSKPLNYSHLAITAKSSGTHGLIDSSFALNRTLNTNPATSLIQSPHF